MTDTVAVGAQPMSVVVTDIDRDGQKDILVGNNGAGTVTILFGKEDLGIGRGGSGAARSSAALGRELFRAVAKPGPALPDRRRSLENELRADIGIDGTPNCPPRAVMMLTSTDSPAWRLPA